MPRYRVIGHRELEAERVVAKAGWTSGGPNPRFVVTLKAATKGPEELRRIGLRGDAWESLQPCTLTQFLRANA